MDDLKKENFDFKKEEVLTALVEKIQANLPAYQASLGQIRANEKSALLNEADDLRDADLQALRDSIKPYRASKRETEKTAYTNLKLLFDTYKDTHKKHYEEETALISNLLEKLASDKYKSQVETLAIAKFVENLKESHQAFESLFASRSQDKLQSVSFDVKKLRKEVATPYQQLTDYVSILTQAKEDELYKRFLSVLNNSRKHYADTLARRKGKDTKATETTVTE
ncbi:hypothetical protein SCRDD08_00171 [Streptococcus cristatus]|uniref:Uncharacterized protein n=1 Tax=Streptococcus cristatus TaxID=45634 RepID=A0A139N590_STRCR|nr:hypothetical protein SCRDD08_00171 [Streptococcus cristatus]